MMNRKRGANSKAIPIGAKETLRDVLGSIEPAEYTRLYKASILNDDNITPEVYEEMQREISERIGRPIHFAAYNNDPVGGGNDAFDHEAKNLDIRLLYQECWAFHGNAVEHVDTVLHKISRTSPDYKSLYKWRKFNQVTQPFIKPVHFQLGAGRQFQTTVTLNTSVSTPLTIIQNKLIASHRDATSLALAAFIEPLETLLDVVLMKAIFYCDAVFLFFEWADPMPFIFLMAFVTHFKPTIPLSANTAYVLSRRDVLPDPGSTVVAEEEDEQTTMVVEESSDTTTTKIRIVMSESADGNPIITALKRQMSTVFISYVTSGYIKRE